MKCSYSLGLGSVAGQRFATAEGKFFLDWASIQVYLSLNVNKFSSRYHCKLVASVVQADLVSNLQLMLSSQEKTFAYFSHIRMLSMTLSSPNPQQLTSKA